MTENILILVGGRSTEHDASLRSYENIIQELRTRAGFPHRLIGVIYITRDGRAVFHDAAGPDNAPIGEAALLAGANLPKRELLSQIVAIKATFVYSFLHGTEGEDGCVQGVAEFFDLPGNFDPTSCAALMMTKFEMACVADGLCDELTNIPTVALIAHDLSEKRVGYAQSRVEALGEEVVVKPNSMGASLLTRVVKTNPASEWQLLARQIFAYDSRVLVQERIRGREITVGVVNGDRGPFPLPPLEAFTGANFLGHEEKHKKGHVKAAFCEHDDPIADVLTRISLRLFDFLGCRHLCRFDYLWDPNCSSIYFLEANLLPGLMNGSAFPKMMAQAGHQTSDVIDFAVQSVSCYPMRNKILKYEIE